MNLSELCIRRPVMTVLLTVALVAGGVAGYRLLPVAALPSVDFPTITVSALLPGASTESMAASVATPLEREFSTIAGIDSMISTSALGTAQITMQFVLDRDIDAAAQDVQAAISRAERRLPAEMTTPPSYRKVNPADQPVLFLSLASATLPLSTVDRYAETVVAPRLSTLSGVAQVLVYGQQKFAVRAQFNPEALFVRGIGIDEAQRAIAEAESNTPVGSLSGPRQEVTLDTNAQLADAASFRQLIIAYRNGAPVRLGEVATVIDSVENDKNASWANGTRAIVLAVQRQPGSNTVAVVDSVKALLPEFRTVLPAGIGIEVLNDRSLSIRAAVADVELTLKLTVGLVVLVIFLFLRRASATFIPAIALPVSLIATFGAMQLLGFSIDNISLLGLTLSVGLVVDDAVVMLENIARHVESGESAWKAALEGSREVGFTILSMTLSLVAVFIPIFFMGGVVGRLFREFAVVVALAILVSAFVSLTLTPMLCSRMLRRSGEHRENAFQRALERAFLAVQGVYARTLRWALAHRPIVLGVTALTLVGAAHLFAQVPKGFIPTEDTGQLFITTEAGLNTSFPSMVEHQQRVAEIVRADPAVLTLMSSVGGTGSTLNNGRMFASLKPKDQRGTLNQVIQRLRSATAAVPGMSVYIQPIQSLSAGGRLSKNLYQYTVQGLDQNELYSWSARLADALGRLALLQDVTTDLQLNNLQAFVSVDREKAASLGVSVDAVRSALYSAYGDRQAATIYTPIDDYDVIVELDPRFQADAGELSKLYVRSSADRMVPLDAFTTIERTTAPLTINHQGQIPAVTISFNLSPGVALGQAVDAVKQTERDIGLPPTIATSFQGTAKVFEDALAGQGILLLGAVLVIYVVLGVLYESFIHPITILSGLPSAAVGGLLALMLFGRELSVIAIIGIVMLIGIVKKNAIMMIDFAVSAQRERGAAPREAIEQACLLRFRPIMMTTMAALAGTLPIALGQGASAELRQPLGIVVVGGLLLSQIVTLYITPVLFLYLEAVGAATRRGWLRLTGSAPAAPTEPREKPRSAEVVGLPERRRSVGP